MRALLTSPLGFLIGFSLGALGGGGSILAVPALVYAAGLDARHATTGSLLLVGAASAVGMIGHYRAGRVAVGTGIAFGISGIGGSIAGTSLNRRLDVNVLLLCFAGLVIIAAWRMLTGCPTCTKVGETAALANTTDSPRRSFRLDAGAVATVLVAGTAVGFLSGLFGVGGGFVIVPALTLGLKLPMPRAIGTSLLIITINSTIGFANRLSSARIDWAAMLPFVVAAIGGVTAGSRAADRLDPKRSLRAFAVLLVVVAIYTAARATVALT